MAHIGVVGLGKMGLPIATYFAVRGHSVVGVDIDERAVSLINRGESPVIGEQDLEGSLVDVVANGSLSASTSFESLRNASVVVVLVPLLAHHGKPDFTTLDGAVASMAPHLGEGVTVIFETTLPVGTTRNRFAPVIREACPSASVAFSPERVFSGRIFRDLESYPKIVGGVDGTSTDKAVAFYESVLDADVWPVASSEEAEMVKLAETTYRDLNIAFANELARICEGLGIDVTDVIKGANSQPFSHIHQPGVGVGGHCIPHYPHLLLSSGIPSALISTGRDVNDSMPEWTVGVLEKAMGTLEGKTIVGLGIAYRPGVREHESSPTFGVAEAVAQRGGRFMATDPLYDDRAVEALGLSPWNGDPADAYILITPHTEFSPDAIPEGAVLLDGRNAWDGPSLTERGVRYLGFGR